MTEITVVEGATDDAPLAEVEAVAEVTAEAEIAHADARVEVAEIEAARDVQIAEIQAEVAEVAIEAASEESELEQCRTQISVLTNRITALEEAQLTRQQSEPPPTPPAEPESLEPTLENQEVQEPAKRRKPRLRLI